MNPKEILMDFQSKLKIRKGSRPQLSGPLEKYHPTSEANLVVSKEYRAQHFRNVLNESVRFMDYCKQPSSSAVVVKYCPNCTCNDCQSQEQTSRDRLLDSTSFSGNGLLNSTVASLFQMHEQHLQVLRQQFLESVIPVLAENIQRPPPECLDQKIHIKSSPENPRIDSFQQERFLTGLNLTKKDALDCYTESSVKCSMKNLSDTSNLHIDKAGPETNLNGPLPIYKQRVVENHSSSLLMLSQSGINEDEVNENEVIEDNQYISFASGSQCLPLRRSSHKIVPVKDCEIKLVDIMNASTEQPLPLSSSIAEEASFLQDLSIANKRPTAMKPRKTVMETGRTRSGRTTQVPKKYWITHHKENEDEIRKSERIQAKDKSVTKLLPKNAKKISSGRSQTCPDNSRKQVSLKKDTAKRLKRSVKVGLEPDEFPLHKKVSENLNDIPIKKRKVTGPSKEIESVSKFVSKIVVKPPAKSKAKCRSNQGQKGALPEMKITQACLQPIEQPKDSGCAPKLRHCSLTTNDKESNLLLQEPKKRGGAKKKQMNIEAKTRKENVSISESEPQYDCYFRKRN